jgi:hypothetical protein
MLISKAIAYQFAKVGNDEEAKTFLHSLDNDKKLGAYIDCVGMLWSSVISRAYSLQHI